MPKGPKGKPRSTSSDVPLDDNENFIKLLETALKSERIIKCLKDALVTDLQRDNAELSRMFINPPHILFIYNLSESLFLQLFILRPFPLLFHRNIYTTKIDGVVCPPNISATVAGRLMKLAHRPRIASTATKLISKPMLLSIL